MRWERWMPWECRVFGAAVAASGYCIWAPGLGGKFPLMLGTGFTCPRVVPGTGSVGTGSSRCQGRGKAQAAPELLQQGKLSCLPWQRCLTNPSGNLSLGKPSPCKHGPDGVPGSASRGSSPSPGSVGTSEPAPAGRDEVFHVCHRLGHVPDSTNQQGSLQDGSTILGQRADAKAPPLQGFPLLDFVHFWESFALWSGGGDPNPLWNPQLWDRCIVPVVL